MFWVYRTSSTLSEDYPVALLYQFVFDFFALLFR